MLPSGLFRSRWATLLWAAGIVWTAYDVAAAHRGDRRTGTPATPLRDATGTAVDPADLAVLANAGG